MTARALMLQGTGTDVGKSVLTAAFCRLARQRGLSVAPFKPQNKSNNAAVCRMRDGRWGGEIGRAQALQALACGLGLHVDMNPVLLKPETDRRAQIVVQGLAQPPEDAATYMANRGRLLGAVLDSFENLCARHDLVLVEGAGSPAETNLRRGDIANMGFARAADVPVCLIGDIDKGGVIASLVGTQSVMDPDDAAMITSFVVNKFRGDIRLFDDGVTDIEARTGWPCLGVIPWQHAAARLPSEDAVQLAPMEAIRGKALKIVAPMLSRIANFDDADPLRAEPGVDFLWIPPGRPLPRDADVVILFGTKSTLGDLKFLRAQGWDHDILAHARTGGRLLGLCGGYQMLGRRISDPDGHDGVAGEADGLGLLDVETTMGANKRLTRTRGTDWRSGVGLSGYEIHTGSTVGPDTQRPFAELESGPDGAVSADGRIEGTYLHGAFTEDAFRSAWLQRAGGRSSQTDYERSVEQALDDLADGVAQAVDWDRFLSLARQPTFRPD